jgi:antitoxin (DNA-binding transcriptional repressor) of toxin-antitoxin stability system
MDRVKATGETFVITKRGRPVAQLGPVTDDLRPFVGRSRGVISAPRDALLAPLDEDWQVDADL